MLLRNATWITDDVSPHNVDAKWCGPINGRAGRSLVCLARARSKTHLLPALVVVVETGNNIYHHPRGVILPFG
eukprot:7920979-Lingulodinium_polyedra.AAC.1